MTNALFNIETLQHKIRPTDAARQAWILLKDAYPLHPAVKAALEQYEPANWVDLFWQWPYIATTDSTKLAYSRSEQHLMADRQTVTSVAKYLKQHFPTMPDHVLQGFSKLTSVNRYRLIDNSEEMIAAIEVGPGSCMKGHLDQDDVKAYIKGEADLNWEEHPCAAYTPDLSWRLAVRYTSKWDIQGRAMVHLDSKRFVRSYRQPEGNDRSVADSLLEDWLESQGFTKANHFSGAHLAKIQTYNTGNGYILPYLDGDYNNVEDVGATWNICSDGEYRCDCTDGDATGASGCTCDRCGDRVDEDEAYWISDEDRHVCEHCFDNYYTCIDGEYVNDDYVITVGDECYDRRNLPDYIVQLADGDYAHIDDTVCIDGDYYEVNSWQVVKLAEETSNGDSYGLREDCWQDADGDWHSDEVDMVEINGSNYKEEDCEFDEITGIWYVPGTEMVKLASGMVVHPENPVAKQLELV